MIQGVRFNNFKVLRELELPFERLTVLVGPNGCGKASRTWTTTAPKPATPG